MDGSTPPCDAYVLLYAYFCIGILFGMALLIYSLATLYSERILSKALQSEGIITQKGRVVYLESLQAMSKELDELQLSLKTSFMLQSLLPDEMPRSIDRAALGRVVPMQFNLNGGDSPKVHPYCDIIPYHVSQLCSLITPLLLSQHLLSSHKTSSPSSHIITPSLLTPS